MAEVITLQTREKREIIDLTAQIEKIVSLAKIPDGICLVNVPHATAAIYLNENEEGLKKDMLAFLENLVPQRSYFHNLVDNNAQAHLLSSLIGTSVTIPVIQGKPGLGIWQRILFVELDGPRQIRHVFVHVQKTF